MRYYLIAGEASGDLHGSNLIRGIRKADSGAVFRFWGGDKMAEAGGAENLAMHYKKASFMGFTEVLLHLRTIFRQMDECKADIAAFRPDVLILIDYAGFNLRIARFAKENGIPTYYYIAPKVWAWKESRVKKIREYVDRLFVIFPFEIDYFRSKEIAPVYEGNPLIDSIDQRQDGPAVPQRICRPKRTRRPSGHRTAGRKPPVGNRLQPAVHGRTVETVPAIPVRRGRGILAR